MPASYIKNESLKKKYKELDNADSDTSDARNGEPSVVRTPESVIARMREALRDRSYLSEG